MKKIKALLDVKLDFSKISFKKLSLNKVINLSDKKNNFIISIVALLQCLIILGFTTFSWIESSSSLVIKGENLPIASNLNYRFDVQSAGTTNVDLSTYFRPTALYQFAQSSTVDGSNFFFKKEGQTTYRQGDTTDYNTSYYNFDFQIHNTSGNDYNYYFESADIFTATCEDSSVTEDMLTVVEDAFRICITAGTTSNSVAIYSKEDRTYNAVNTTTGGTSSVTPKTLSGSSYVYNGSNPETFAVFNSTAGTEDTKVNIKIWFEEKDTRWVALSDEQKEALLGCNVKINLKFMNSSSDFKTFFFDDYTFSTVSGHEGQPMTLEDDTKSLYFCYNNNSSLEIVPMMVAPSNGVALRWVTSDGDGNAVPRISKDIIDEIKAHPTYGYFFYGTVNSNGTPVETYRWQFDANSKPTQNDAGTYVYQALSVIENASGSELGYGVWGNKPVQLFSFVDRTTFATNNPYNANGYQFVVQKGQGALYLNNTGSYKKETTKMYYDSANDIWKGYYPAEYINNLIFMYSSDGKCGTKLSCKWNALTASMADGENYVYTALGYTTNGALEDLTISTGIGTWSNVEKIRVSAELIEIGMNADYRYKVGLASGTDFYYMAKDNTDMHYFAYVVENYGTTRANALAFRYYTSVDESEAAGIWNTVAFEVRDGSDTYYLTGRNTGQWHIAVLVDGSSINIINDTLNSVTGSMLEYSVDGTNYQTMIKLDDYRWYTETFPGSTEKVYYRYTAYPNSSAGVQDGAIFTYGHDLVNGIYFNITE